MSLQIALTAVAHPAKGRFLHLEPTLNKVKSPLVFGDSELVSSGSVYCLFHIVIAAKPLFVCNIIHCFATEANFFSCRDTASILSISPHARLS